MGGIGSRAFHFSSARNGSHRTAASRPRLAYSTLRHARIINRSNGNHLLANFLGLPARRNRPEPSLEEGLPDVFAVWTT